MHPYHLSQLRLDLTVNFGSIMPRACDSASSRDSLTTFTNRPESRTNMFARYKIALPIGFTFAALLAICLAWLMINVDLLQRLLASVNRYFSFQIVPYPIVPHIIELLLFGFIINFLIYGAAVFTLTRLGYLRRQELHRPAAEEELMVFYEDTKVPPSLTVLIPSYKEEPEVVWRTLISAALLEYPRRNVVLLIDDPPKPGSDADRALLESARRLPDQVAELLNPMLRRLACALTEYQSKVCSGSFDTEQELLILADLCDVVADWFEAQADAYPVCDHEAAFYVEQILRRPARGHRQRAKNLRSRLGQESEPSTIAFFDREYRRLAALFDVEVTSFERKQFENLSHEANKAMNLNSYIGLMGQKWRTFTLGTARYLQEALPGQDHFLIAEPDYVITLDADSLLMHEYALVLVHEMEKPERQRTAIIQTPYNAFPGAPSALEYIAGAQTDMQYIVHQGFTAHGATYWVGANALLRKRALDEIVGQATERGHVVKKYIQDRTVIEDTESSIDLVERNWALYNYPARMAYSATPPDFGTLLIQRRRWANGGLIIYPKLLRYLLRGPGRIRKVPEGFLRAHYLISTAFTNFGLLMLILLSLDTSLVSGWLILSVGVYFAVYAESLKEFGYRRRDLFQVWALNLLLIPVNLAGASKSVQQAVSHQRVPFSRTPKVGHRTATPAWLILWLIGLTAICAGSAIFEILKNGPSFDAVFAAVNGFIFYYGISVFIEWTNAWEDLRLALPQKAAREVEAAAEGGTASGV